MFNEHKFVGCGTSHNFDPEIPEFNLFSIVSSFEIDIIISMLKHIMFRLTTVYINEKECFFLISGN